VRNLYNIFVTHRKPRINREPRVGRTLSWQRTLRQRRKKDASIYIFLRLDINFILRSRKKTPRLFASINVRKKLLKLSTLYEVSNPDKILHYLEEILAKHLEGLVRDVEIGYNFENTVNLVIWRGNLLL